MSCLAPTQDHPSGPGLGLPGPVSVFISFNPLLGATTLVLGPRERHGCAKGPEGSALLTAGESSRDGEIKSAGKQCVCNSGLWLASWVPQAVCSWEKGFPPSTLGARPNVVLSSQTTQTTCCLEALC